MRRSPQTAVLSDRQSNLWRQYRAIHQRQSIFEFVIWYSSPDRTGLPNRRPGTTGRNQVPACPAQTNAPGGWVLFFEVYPIDYKSFGELSATIPVIYPWWKFAPATCSYEAF